MYFEKFALIYSNFKSGKTIGEALIAEKEKYKNDNENPTYKLQIYGDPTLKIS